MKDIFIFIITLTSLKGVNSCSEVTQLGDTSDCVKVIQRAVGAPANGTFGSGTEAKVKEFQTSLGLTASGVVDQETWSGILWLATSKHCGLVASGDIGECVKVVQRAFGVTVDGNFGSETELAVISMRTAYGLSPYGVVGQITWNATIYGGSCLAGTLVPNACGCAFEGAHSCTGAATPGATKLADYLRAKYAGTTSIYQCRNIGGTSTLSPHSEGRAIDHYVAPVTGDKVWDELTSVACDIGIQSIIWNRKYWRPHGIYNYTGQSPHTDHVHIDVNRCAGDNLDTSHS